MLGAEPSQSGPRFTILSGDSRLRLTLRWRAHYGIWLAEGTSRKESASTQLRREVCPYCAQDLSGSPLISHYRAYFGEAYAKLKSDIAGTVKYVEKNHGGEVAAAFERTVRVAVQRREFWQRFLRIPKIELDTARIARAWYRARDNVLAALNAKQASPLERIALSESDRREIAQHNRGIQLVAAVRVQLEVINGQIAIVKERAAAANITTLRADLAMLRAVAARQDPTVTALCDAYRAAKLAKARTEGLCNQARVALDQYRVTIFPAYENAINDYLRKFNAGFRLTRVASTNTRGGIGVHLQRCHQQTFGGSDRRHSGRSRFQEHVECWRPELAGVGILLCVAR